jgi:hypothetical protein
MYHYAIEIWICSFYLTQFVFQWNAVALIKSKDYMVLYWLHSFQSCFSCILGGILLSKYFKLKSYILMSWKLNESKWRDQERDWKETEWKYLKKGHRERGTEGALLEIAGNISGWW